MPLTDHDSTELGSWGDEVWGPRDPAIIDLRPEICPARRPPKEEPVQTVDGGLPAFADGDDTTLDGIRVEIASHVTRVTAVLDELSTQVASIASGDGLRFLVRTAVAETVEAIFTRFHGEHLAGEAEAHQEQHGQPAAVVPRTAGSLTEELEGFRSGGQRQIVEAMAGLVEQFNAAITSAGESQAAAIRDLGEEFGAQLTGVSETTRSSVARVAEAASSTAQVLGERLAATEAALADRVEQLDASLGDFGRECRALASAVDQRHAELSERLGHPAAANQKQTALFEQALGALSRAVADERHSSAALVRSSLANTDQAIRDAYSWLQQYFDSLLHIAREAAATASAAAEETRAFRRDLRQVLQSVPPAQGGE